MHERLPQLNITQSELAPRVADYFDNLLAQRDAILTRYNLTPETAEQFCNLRSTDEDRETILALYERMVYVIENKQIPPSEVLEQERIQEQHRINEFFGKEAHIEVPPLPPTITPERIEQWKHKRFELRYLPPLTLKEDDEYPGWKKKPTKNMNLFDNLARIQNVPRNQNNPYLADLIPTQLPGCWMLIDTRPKPNHENNAMQMYADDGDIKTIIKELVNQEVVGLEAGGGSRNLIHPNDFEHPAFWQPFYEYLDITKEEAVIRLPRVIEQSMFGQGTEWDGTSFYEWSEEFSQVGWRFMLGSSDWGGVSWVSWFNGTNLFVGFRPVVVFSSP